MMRQTSECKGFRHLGQSMDAIEMNSTETLHKPWLRKIPSGTSTLVNSPRPGSPLKYYYEELETDTEYEREYPTLWKLALITTGICLCVFCMALVGSSLLSGASFKANVCRITQSWQQLSPKLPVNSTRWTMLDGTAARTYSRLVP